MWFVVLFSQVALGFPIGGSVGLMELPLVLGRRRAEVGSGVNRPPHRLCAEAEIARRSVAGIPVES